MSFLDGLTFGAGQAIGQAFTFLTMLAGVVLISLWFYRRIMR